MDGSPHHGAFPGDMPTPSRQRGEAEPAGEGDRDGRARAADAPAADGASKPPAGSVTLSDAIIEVEKTIRDRGRRYPDLVAKKRLKPETADHKLASLRKAHDVLMFVEANEAWIRAEFARRVCSAKAAGAASSTDEANA